MFGLSIIIVNYKSHKLIADCLESIKKFALPFDHEIIIVDNDSQDEGKIFLTKNYPCIIWHEMHYNAGFARANNEGIRIATFDYILLLNPDTIVLENAIGKVFSKFSNSNFVACGVQLLNSDYSYQISGSDFYLGGLNYILPIPILGKLLKRVSQLFGAKPSHVKKAEDIKVVEWINGAFLMVKKSVIEKVGLMDEEFFLYGEEIEWCSRLGKEGMLAIYGDCKVLHFISGTIQANTGSNDNTYTNFSDRKGLQIMVSNHLLILKRFGFLWFFFHLLFHSLGAVLNVIFSPLISIYSQISFVVHFKNAMAYLRNVLRIWFLLPRFLSDKPYLYKVI